MSISNFAVQKRGQEGSWTSTGERNYTTVLQCLSNDPKDNQVTVLNATANYLGIPLGVPAYVIFANLGNDDDPFAKLKKMTARCTASGSVGEYKEWLVTLEFDSNAEQLPDNPLLRPTQISGTFQEYLKAVEKDRNGKPITNTANYPFDPPLEMPDARFNLTMTRNEIIYDPAYFANNYINYINSVPWYGGTAGQWRCVNVAGTGPHIENDVAFFTLTYEFQFHIEGWQPQVQNRGKKAINGVPCVDAYNNPTQDGEYLATTGFQLQFNQIPGGINFVKPLVFYETDFNALGLP